MTLDNFILLLLAVAVCCLGMWCMAKIHRSNFNALTGSNPPVAPQVIVNVPAEFKPMESLPPTQIEGARAILFWSVYSKAIDAFTEDGSYTLDADDEQEALNSARAAVETVFKS